MEVITFHNAMFFGVVSESLPRLLGKDVASRLQDQQRDGDRVEDWYISGLRHGYAHIQFTFLTVYRGRWAVLEGNTTIRI